MLTPAAILVAAALTNAIAGILHPPTGASPGAAPVLATTWARNGTIALTPLPYDPFGEFAAIVGAFAEDVSLHFDHAYLAPDVQSSSSSSSPPLSSPSQPSRRRLLNEMVGLFEDVEATARTLCAAPARAGLSPSSRPVASVLQKKLSASCTYVLGNATAAQALVPNFEREVREWWVRDVHRHVLYMRQSLDQRMKAPARDGMFNRTEAEAEKCGDDETACEWRTRAGVGYTMPGNATGASPTVSSHASSILYVLLKDIRCLPQSGDAKPVSSCADLTPEEPRTPVARTKASTPNAPGKQLLDALQALHCRDIDALRQTLALLQNSTSPLAASVTDTKLDTMRARISAYSTHVATVLLDVWTAREKLDPVALTAAARVSGLAAAWISPDTRELVVLEDPVATRRELGRLEEALASRMAALAADKAGVKG
jgi:hypothetical protein